MAGPQSPTKARQTPRQRAQRAHNVAVSSDMSSRRALTHEQQVNNIWASSDRDDDGGLTGTMHKGDVTASSDTHGRRAPSLASPHSMEFGRRSGRRYNGRWMWLLWWGVPVALLLLSVILQTAILMGLQLSSIMPPGGTGKLQGAKPEQLRKGHANGVFPTGCRWRDVQVVGEGKPFWPVERYEFWDERRQEWLSEMPEACLVPGHSNPKRWQWRDGSPRTQVDCDDTHCIYQNLWYNNGRFYLLVGDGNPAVEAWHMTRNQDLHILHVNNASSFVKSVNHRIIKGDTLIFDFVYFLHPTAIGHWGETMFPLYSILQAEDDFSSPPQQFVLLHLKRIHLIEWARTIIATTLGVAPKKSLPPIIMQREHDSVWSQIPQPLEGCERDEWVCFERALVVRDTFTGGVRTFLNREDAQRFRATIYQNHGLPPPTCRIPPRIITFQRKRANRRVINEEQLITLLRTYGEVRVVEFDSGTPFKEQLKVIAATGVFVSCHTSNLANAQFLRPGSAVVELLQRNWIWHNLDKSFQVQTEMMGDIHHYAWRARHRNQTVYIDKRDAERFGEWPSELCRTEECVEAHTNVDVVVNLAELKELLDSRLPLVFKGASVEEAAIPWPETGIEKAAEAAESENSEND